MAQSIRSLQSFWLFTNPAAAGNSHLAQLNGLWLFFFLLWFWWQKELADKLANSWFSVCFHKSCDCFPSKLWLLLSCGRWNSRWSGLGPQTLTGSLSCLLQPCPATCTSLNLSCRWSSKRSWGPIPTLSEYSDQETCGPRCCLYSSSLYFYRLAANVRQNQVRTPPLVHIYASYLDQAHHLRLREKYSKNKWREWVLEKFSLVPEESSCSENGALVVKPFMKPFSVPPWVCLSMLVCIFGIAAAEIDAWSGISHASPLTHTSQTHSPLLAAVWHTHTHRCAHTQDGV